MKKILGIPKAAKQVVAPTVDDEAIKRAKEEARRKIQNREGSSSTVLSDLGQALGG
jgi:hypothetical protein